MATNCFVTASAEAEAEPRAPRVIAAVVIFRHGARAPVFHTPDEETQRCAYDTVSAAPSEAARVTVLNAKHALAYSPPGFKGLLTTVGWEQGVALGRRLSARYGRPALPTVHSTDVSRTILTAHAVLTGLYQGVEPPPLEIHVDRTQDLMVPTTCAPLAQVSSHGVGRVMVGR